MVRRAGRAVGTHFRLKRQWGRGALGTHFHLGWKWGGCCPAKRERGSMLGAGVGFPRRGGNARAGAVAFETRAEILQGVSRPADSAWGLPGGEGRRRVCRVCLGGFRQDGREPRAGGFITIPSRGAAWGYPQ